MANMVLPRSIPVFYLCLNLKAELIHQSLNRTQVKVVR
ncbi:hypothetical protein BA1DRAFT_02550 [Photorhabdus aegyptia]|uniref:Uncharacterized protein n=1 Tax=Photorhabdus aegyptia TaxID=2805098 RepID=A0A022PK39_9GAMM|nr:hypothetical protein BA1DRAFT_02550 [Photorhabdus aegyptia]